MLAAGGRSSLVARISSMLAASCSGMSKGVGQSQTAVAHTRNVVFCGYFVDMTM
jgi:hypothetical protein